MNNTTESDETFGIPSSYKSPKGLCYSYNGSNTLIIMSSAIFKWDNLKFTEI